MLKLPKGLKKKKKKSKKDQELFTEAELEEYKRQQKAKQEAAAAKSDAGESDAASDVEGLAQTATTSATATTSELAEATTSATGTENNESAGAAAANGSQKSNENDDEWAKFKALTSGVDTILHKTQDELDRIKKESFYQRLPSAAEKKKQEEEEAARLEAERLEEEKRLAAEKEANRDKLAEAVVELSDSDVDDEAEVDDLFETEYVDAITSGDFQFVPDSPVLEFDDGPDPFDTDYAEKVILGADKAKGNKKLVSLGAAVEVLSGRVDRETALEYNKPHKRKLRKGIKNLLLSESVDQGDADEEDLLAPEPQINLLDELVDDIPDHNPIDLSVSLHLSFIQPKKPVSDEEEDEKETAEGAGFLDLSEFDTLKTPDDDEFAELAAESLNKKEEIKILTEIPLPKAEILSQIVESDWAEFEEERDTSKGPPPRPTSGPHFVPGAIYVSDDEEAEDDDPFNTSYAEQVIKKTTALEEDDDFDPRAEEKALPPGRPPPPAPVKLFPEHIEIDLEADDFDPFDTSVAGAVIVLSKTTLKQSLSDPDFDPRAESPPPKVSPPAVAVKTEEEFDIARRKSSFSLSLQNKSVGFLVPSQDLLGTAEGGSNKKPLTPYYAPTGSSIAEKDSEDPFDTSYVPANKPSDIELKHLENDLLAKPTLEADPDFNPRAPPTPVPAEDLLSVQDNINAKVLTPAQESKDLPDDLSDQNIDPFDTSIASASNIQPGQAELKQLESELLPTRVPDVHTGVLDTQSDAQELGLGDKVLTPQLPHKQIIVPVEVDPFDTSIAENLQPGETEIKLLESELIDH